MADFWIFQEAGSWLDLLMGWLDVESARKRCSKYDSTVLVCTTAQKVTFPEMRKTRGEIYLWGEVLGGVLRALW